MAPEEGLKPARREEDGLQVVGAETRREGSKDWGFYSRSVRESLKDSKPDTARIRSALFQGHPGGRRRKERRAERLKAGVAAGGDTGHGGGHEVREQQRSQQYFRGRINQMCSGSGCWGEERTLSGWW